MQRAVMEVDLILDKVDLNKNGTIDYSGKLLDLLSLFRVLNGEYAN